MSIKKPAAVESPYVTTDTTPTRLASAPVAGGGVSTVASTVSATVSATADANANTTASSTGSNVSYYTSGVEGIAGLANYGRVFDGANVYVTLEQQQYNTYNQTFTISDSISVTGNITTSDGYFIGDGSQLTGISSLGNFIVNGNSYANIASANGSLVIGINGGNTWTFNSNSTLTAPGGSQWTNQANADAYFTSSLDGYVHLQSLFADGNIGSEVFLEHGLMQITAHSLGANTDYVWTFDNGGNLTLPGNTFQINYANGSPVSLVSTYGNANVVANLAALGSNPVSTTGNVTSGNINSPTLNNSGNINIVSSGNTWSFKNNGTTSFPNNIINPGNDQDLTIRTQSSGNAYTVMSQTSSVWEAFAEDDTTEANDAYAWIRADLQTANTPRVFIQNVRGSDGLESTWTFDSVGGTIFPTLTTQRGDGTSGTITGQTLLFGDNTQESVISTPNGNVDYINSQRLVINPGEGYGSGEGGDIYLWAGRGGNNNGSGGDVKIRGGQGLTDGTGGYIRIEAGDSQANGAPGFIEITGGTGGNAVGGYVRILAGQGQTNGGDANITGGVGQTGTGGAVNITGGVSGLGLADYGNVNINAGSSTWTFDNTGVLTVPGEGIIQSIGDTVTLKSFNTSTGNANSVYLGTSGGLGFNDQEIGGNWLEIFRNGTEPEIRVPVGLGNLNIQTASGNTPYNWTFDDTGNLTLPQGGVVHETGIPFGGLEGNTIALKPSGGSNADQQLLVYPTAGADFNHLHLTSGNLYNTELFLGSDNLYVKLANTGNIVINSNDNTGNTAQWTFGTDGTILNSGNLTLQTPNGVPGAVTAITGSSGSWESNPSSNLATTGGTGTGLTVNVTQEGGYAGTIAIATAGTGYTNGDAISVVSGSSSASFTISVLANGWTIDTAGNLTVAGSIIMPPNSILTGTNASPAPSINGFTNISAINFSATGNVFGNIYPQTGAVLYVDGNRTDTYAANGTINFPYKTVQDALDDATANTTINIAPGTYSENIVMPDLDGICINGGSEMNTVIANATTGHTLYWSPANTVGNSISKFCIQNIELVNTDTTGIYHTLHIDASNVVYPDTFIGEEMDVNTVDFEGSQSQANTTVYLNNVGAQNIYHSQVLGGAVTVINPGQFRSTGMVIGNTSDPHDFNVTYDGNLPRNGLGRNDITLAAGSAVFGNVTLNGHPIYQEDVDSVIVGNLNGANLSTFYASGRDYSPTILAYGQHGVIGGAGGSINLTFPDPNTSGASFNFVDFSNGHILGKVNLTKANLLPLSARGYAVVQGQAQFDTTAANGISANGYVALDIRGANFNQSTLQATGAATIDRSVVTLTSRTATTAGNVISISPPLAAGATYTTAVTPNSNSTVWVTSKNTGNLTVTASANTTVDITVTRNT